MLFVVKRLIHMTEIPLAYLQLFFGKKKLAKQSD